MFSQVVVCGKMSHFAASLHKYCIVFSLIYLDNTHYFLPSRLTYFVLRIFFRTNIYIKLQILFSHKKFFFSQMAAVLPELLRSRLPSLIFDQPLAVAHPQCRTLCLAICQSLGLSSSADFQLSLDMCRSLTKTCAFCLQAEDEVNLLDVV